MERDQNQFSPELLQMMRDEEREKFLSALKEGAPWGQLFQIRNNIRRLNEMIEALERSGTSSDDRGKDSAGRSHEDPGPRHSNG